ncbi:MAG: DUF262 domain-containing protein [Lachnospiraceae bacterium]|nr:DUF262 domain-containing protein [Lachnospiraceae bacterium]
MESNKTKFKNAMIQQYKTDIGFRTLVESVNDNMYIIPKYQRKYRWTKKQLIDLVDSLINGLPIPPIYTCRNSENQLEILDGQQRVMSLFFYYIGYFLNVKENSAVDFSELDVHGSFAEALKEKMSVEELHIDLADIDGNRVNVDYNQLPIEIKRKIDYTTITVIEMKIDPDENREVVLRKTFANLNRGGTLLTTQEQRNGIYNCEFYDMLQRFNSENQAWRNVWGRKCPKEKDMEILLRFCALTKYAKYNEKEAEFVIVGYHSKYNELLDSFSEESMKFSTDIVLEYKEKLEEFVKLFDVHRKMSSNVTLLESFYAIYHIFNFRKPITQKICDEVLKGKDYTESSRQGTARMKKISKRWKAVHDIWSRESESSNNQDD